MIRNPLDIYNELVDWAMWYSELIKFTATPFYEVYIDILHSEINAKYIFKNFYFLILYVCVEETERNFMQPKKRQIWGACYSLQGWREIESSQKWKIEGMQKDKMEVCILSPISTRLSE